MWKYYRRFKLLVKFGYLVTSILGLVVIDRYVPLFSQSQQEIQSQDIAAGDFFGASVAIDDDWLIAGAIFDQEPFEKSGSAYLFEHSGGVWSQQAKLVPSEPGTNNLFGYSVALSGSIAVIGAPWDDAPPEFNSGSAYVFARDASAWTEQSKLIASDAAALHYLGWSVATDGTTVAVGAPLATSRGITETGAVYVYTVVNDIWTEQSKLMAPDPVQGDYFGRSVAVSGNTIVVGAFQSDLGATDGGAAFVFQRSNNDWTHSATLIASDAAPGDAFGESISLDGNLLLIGSWLTDENGDNSGSAYIFSRAGEEWSQEAKLMASDGAADDRLGFRVGLRGGVAAVGARGDDHSGVNDAGSTYLFREENGTWQQIAKLIASNPMAEDNFGIGVAISATFVASGAERTDNVGEDSGSIFMDVVPASSGHTGSPPPTPTPSPTPLFPAPSELQQLYLSAMLY